RKKVNALTPLKTGLRNNDNGIIGSLRVASVRMKTNIITTPAPKAAATLQCVHPTNGIRRQPSVSNARPHATATAPGQSSESDPFAPRLSGTCRHRKSSAAVPSGILMKKMARHHPASASAPPRIGPPMVTMVVKEDQEPMA